MKSKGGKVNLDNLDNLDSLGKYTLADARRLWMVWWNRNAPDLLNLKAKHHAEGQRAFQQLLTEARTDLRTDEAIERLANFLFEDDNGMSIDQHEKICHDASKCRFRSDYTQFARAAIAALLGEEP